MRSASHPGFERFYHDFLEELAGRDSRHMKELLVHLVRRHVPVLENVLSIAEWRVFHVRGDTTGYSQPLPEQKYGGGCEFVLLSEVLLQTTWRLQMIGSTLVGDWQHFTKDGDPRQWSRIVPSDRLLDACMQQIQVIRNEYLEGILSFDNLLPLVRDHASAPVLAQRDFGMAANLGEVWFLLHEMGHVAHRLQIRGATMNGFAHLEHFARQFLETIPPEALRDADFERWVAELWADGFASQLMLKALEENQSRAGCDPSCARRHAAFYAFGALASAMHANTWLEDFKWTQGGPRSPVRSHPPAALRRHFCTPLLEAMLEGQFESVEVHGLSAVVDRIGDLLHAEHRRRETTRKTS